MVISELWIRLLDSRRKGGLERAAGSDHPQHNKVAISLPLCLRRGETNR